MKRFFSLTVSVMLLVVFSVTAFAAESVSQNDENIAENKRGRYLGDVNNDGSVSADDARFILRYSVGLEAEKSGLDLLYLNVDTDKSISASDARKTLRMSVGLESLISHNLKNAVKTDSSCSVKGYTQAACEDCNTLIQVAHPLLPHTPHDYPCNGITECTVCKTHIKVEPRHNFSDYHCTECGKLDCKRVKNDIATIAHNKGASQDGVFTYSEKNGSENFKLCHNPATDKVTFGIESELESDSILCKGTISFSDDFEKFEISLDFIRDNVRCAYGVYEITKESLSLDENSDTALIQKKYEGTAEVSSEIKRFAHGYSVSSLLWLQSLLSNNHIPVKLSDLGFTSL